LAGGAASVVMAWTPVFRATAASGATTSPPANFPSSISVYQQAYQNWSGMIVIEDVWTCAPTSPSDVVTLANWAYANGYRLRAKGMSHGWSPLVLPTGNTGAGYVLVDTTQYLTSVSVGTGTVTAQAGVTMDTLTTKVAAAGYGFAAIPAPGDITLGGALAIDAHGSAIPATGETKLTGQTYGSLSNLILSITAVVWNGSAYVLQTFQRDDPDIRAFLVHLGRAFITSVTLQVAASQNLQ
jgi:FAD/FMN-containing dehydrogenase